MKMMRSSHLVLLACLAVFSASHAQQPSEPEMSEEDKQMLEKMEQVGWVRKGDGQLGGVAKIAIPEGFRFTGGSGASQVVQLYGNLPRPNASGMLTTEGFGPWIIFTYKDEGHVPDEEKDTIDADALLERMREGVEASNEVRKERGLDQLEIRGWALPPRYSEKTNTLEWALLIGDLGGKGPASVNYETRMLGRTGVMEVQLVCSPDNFEPLLAEFQTIMKGFDYVEGQRYAEFRQGDKVAKYGLTALVAGTGVVAATKLGLFGKLGVLFAKMGKLAIVAVIAVLAGLKKLFSSIFGGRHQPPSA